MGWAGYLLCVVGIAIGAYLVWISVQSILQARVLFNPVPVRKAESFVGRAVALRGAVEVLAPVNIPSVGECLWASVKYQECTTGGRNATWNTVESDVKLAEFLLREGTAQVRVAPEATEVHGTTSRTETDNGDLLERIFEGSSRTIKEWLPIPAEATVLGKLERSGGTLSLVKHPRLGLFISPDAPRRAAIKEALKGGSGLLLVCATIVGLIVWWNRSGHTPASWGQIQVGMTRGKVLDVLGRPDVPLMDAPESMFKQFVGDKGMSTDPRMRGMDLYIYKTWVSQWELRVVYDRSEEVIQIIKRKL